MDEARPAGGPARRLAALTWTELDAGSTPLHLGAGEAPPVLVVPCGSLEQHGPHLPLDTDTRIATALADRLAAGAGGRMVVGPALPYGASGEHQDFPGTLSVGHRVLAELVTEIVRSARHSLAGVVCVSAHGGNAEALARAAATARHEGDRLLVWPVAVPGGDAHAGRTETSLLLALDPCCVRLAAAVPGSTDPLATLLPSLRAGGVRSVSPSGVLGDPSRASAEEGAVLLDDLLARLRAAVEDWMGAELGTGKDAGTARGAGARG